MKLLNSTTLTVVCFVSLLSIPTYGQMESLDLYIAPGLTSLRGNSWVNETLDPRISVSGGVGINYRLDKQWLVSVKLLYEDKGGGNKGNVFYIDSDNNIVSGEARIRTRFKYLTLPITAGYEFGHKAKFRIEAGPYVAYLLKQIATGDLNDQPQNMMDNTDLDKRADLGLSVGMRVLMPLSEGITFNLGMHDNLGLFNVSARRVINDRTLKTNFLAVSFGLGFKL